MDETVIALSRFQFATVALYHFLFVPLTLGLTFILAIMETTYVVTGKEIYRDMTKFWGKLFGINFALGVTTGLTMEFQFGTNWSYYSHYVGDIFGAPLAIEALVAFFLESTFVGLFFFGWNKLSKGGHLVVTYLVAIGSNLSAALILIANGWMQSPVGAQFNPLTMRMEMTNFVEVLLNPVAQAKFVHTVSAGYVTASLFVLAISSWYLLKKRDLDFAKRSFRIAASFGIASCLAVIVLGDESGYHAAKTQDTKMAAMEAIWDTEPAPAGLTLFGIPNSEKKETNYKIEIPWLLGLIGTRSTDTEIPGINNIQQQNIQRITNGAIAVQLLDKLRKDPKNEQLRDKFQTVEKDLGYGLLLKKYTNDVSQATPEMVAKAAQDSVPSVAPLFWSFRIMVLCGVLLLLIFIIAFYYAVRNNFVDKPKLQKLCLYSLPLPWIAIESGWLLAEYGRQPWSIFGMLPTSLSASTLTVTDLIISLVGFIGLYTILLIVELFLMFKFARVGPSSLGLGRYHHEEFSNSATVASSLSH